MRIIKSRRMKCAGHVLREEECIDLDAGGRI
jgi:hypothetical protein